MTRILFPQWKSYHKRVLTYYWFAWIFIWHSSMTQMLCYISENKNQSAVHWRNDKSRFRSPVNLKVQGKLASMLWIFPCSGIPWNMMFYNLFIVIANAMFRLVVLLLFHLPWIAQERTINWPPVGQYHCFCICWLLTGLLSLLFY